MKPQQLREDLQQGQSDHMNRRRMIIGLSFLGMAALGAVSLLQTGIVKHLPDPPVEGFNSDKVNSSESAYQFGAPDGTLAVVSLAANLPLAAFGGEDRERDQPIVPIVAAGKAAVDAAMAAWYFYQMPTKEKAWCGYCIVGAITQWSIFALSLPEARDAWEMLNGDAREPVVQP